MTEKAKRREKGEVATGMQKPKAVDFEEEGPKKHSEADSMTIEINELYKYKKEDLCIDIGSSTYSNLAYVQASHRDISIDFLEMPGIKKEDGRMHIPGSRIYMSHAAAQKLSKAISGILDTIHSDGTMECFTPEEDQPEKLTTKTRQVSARDTV
jgi:hypothetical protein